MPHTASRYQQDLGFNDACVRFSPWAALTSFNAATDAVLTRNAAGDWSYNQIASKTNIYAWNLLEQNLYRTGFFEDTQNIFGSTFGGGLGGPAAGAGSAGTGIPGSAQPSPYRPDVIAGMSTLQEITPRTGLKIKGIRPISVAVIYQTATNPLTAITCRIDKTIYANNVALAPASVLASAANGLLTAVPTTGPNVTEVAFPAAGQVYQVSDPADLWFELSVQTAGSCTCKIYGVRFKFEFNYA